MSRNDQNAWSDSLDFESLADEQESRQAAAPAADPAPAPAAAAAAEHAKPAATPARRKTPSSPSRPAVSGGGLGVLFALSMLVASFGLAAVLVMALQVDPLGLWQPTGLTSFDTIIDFQQHPLNLVYIVAVATVLLALLGAGAVARAVGRAGDSARRDASLLDRLTSLRIDDEKGWQDPQLKQHAAAAAFVNENVGAWRLVEARQRRSSGLEGEMQRLTRAAGANDRAGLADRYDNPNVGSLADEMLRLFDERESAQQEAGALRAKDREEAERLLGLISESCGWSSGARDKVTAQGEAVAQVARDMGEAAAAAADDSAGEALRALAALQQQVEGLGAGAGDADLGSLVDRSNKLAFQIAMEVARLGPRGERLLPMTQELEELATEFRSVSGGGETGDLQAALVRVHEAVSRTATHAEALGRAVVEAQPATAAAARQLDALGGGFGAQSERLNQAGEACARMTGLSFDPQAVAPLDPVEAPAPDLGFTRFDPFGGPAAAPAAEPAAEPAPMDVDPFATSDPFAASDPFATDEPAPAAPVFGDADPFLAEPEEPVYDLGGFGAVPLEGAASGTPASDEDEVLDLAAFGAVRLDDDEPALVHSAAGLTEEIHDLAEFGAVPLD
jgi:hypothetical protein